MSTSNFAKVASEVHKAISVGESKPKSKIFNKVAREVHWNITAVDRAAEWQRVNSAIADILKDQSMSYSKLARLQGDFAGPELDNLQKIAESILMIGDEMSKFAKSFYDGKFRMQESEIVYGEQGGAPMKNPDASSEGTIAPPADKGPPPPGLFAGPSEGPEQSEAPEQHAQPQAPSGEEEAEEEPQEEPAEK